MASNTIRCGCGCDREIPAINKQGKPRRFAWRSYEFVIPGAKVFATANDINRLSKPLQSRFRCLHLPPYSKEQFFQVAIKVLPKLKEETVGIIAAQVWNTSKDIRDIISVDGQLLQFFALTREYMQILSLYRDVRHPIPSKRII